MAGTRTAPDVSVASPNAQYVTLSVIDASGDNYAVGFKFATAPLIADVEDLVGKYQAVTQTSVYRVEISDVWEGDEDPDNAETDIRYGVESGVNLLYRSGLDSQTHRLVGIIPAAMQGNQDIPLFTDTDFAALITDIGDLTGYSFASGQYTTRRERKNNPRVKA